MRAVVQRVKAARVEVEGEVIGAIGEGLCCFVGAGRDDDESAMGYIADKIVGLRVFTDAEGKMNLSVKDIGGAILAISQFTVYGDVRKGRRPSFTAAMPPDRARSAYERFLAILGERGVPLEQGRFAADMRVLVDNAGPVTILLDSDRAF